MSCECYRIGGRFIAEDPDCPAHGTQARAEREEAESFLQDVADACARAEAEVLAWRERFPQYVYRPQDDIVALKL